MTDRATDRGSTTLRELPEQVRSGMEQLTGLRAVRRRAERIVPLVDDLDRQLERQLQPPVITLAGSTGAGKSTLLNALAGKEIAEAGADRPTTRVPVVYAPRGAKLDDLLDGLPGAQPKVVKYAAGKSAGAWSKQVLVDAPDTNSIEAGNREVVRSLAERSDVLLVVLHRQSVVEEAAVSFLDAFQHRRRLVFLLNRADELTADSRDALLAQIRELARDRWGCPDAPVLAVSALDAQRDPSAPDWQLLLATLQGMVRDGELAALRLENALGTARQLEAQFADARAESLGALAELPRQVAEGLQNLNQRTGEEVSERLRLRRADLDELLWREAARRWDGPGGWALRTHGLASMGIGAGALLVRRNPLLAAGAAAGAVAADQVGQAARRHRVSGAKGLLPPESDFSSWYGQALGEPRLRAGELAGDPEAYAVPQPEPLYASACTAVEEAWDVLVDRELPAAADRSIPRVLRWIADLPVYALGAWVIGKAALGFFTEEYAGMDFLVNALLLLLAYLFVVRQLARRALGTRSARLLQSVIDDAKTRLGTATGPFIEAVRERTRNTTGTLEELAQLESRWRSAARDADGAPATPGGPRAKP